MPKGRGEYWNGGNAASGAKSALFRRKLHRRGTEYTEPEPNHLLPRSGIVSAIRVEAMHVSPVRLRLAGGQRRSLHWLHQTRRVPDPANRCGRLRRWPRLYHRRFSKPVCYTQIENYAGILPRRIKPACRAKDNSPAIHGRIHGQENNVSPGRDGRTPPACLRN